MHVSQILQIDEVIHVVDHLRGLARRCMSRRLDLAIFRLATGCGLRRCEIQAVEVTDFSFGGPRPVIRLRKEVCKGKRYARVVPLWWDQGILDDLLMWREISPDTGTFICHRGKRNYGRQVGTVTLHNRWKRAISVLGPDRVKQVRLHDGRHTFCSHWLHAGRSLAEVRDAVGHRNISTTSIYLHSLESQEVKDIYGTRKPKGDER